MRLRNKIVLSLSAVIALYAVVAWSIQRFVLMPGFEPLEEFEAERDAARASEAIDNEIAHLDSFCFDWAAWDDTYEFIETKSAQYETANLRASIFETGNFTLLYYFDAQGELIWGENRDPEHGYELRELEALPARDWSLDHPLLGNRDITRGIEGIYSTECGPFLISSRPILKSDKTGPLRGWVVMGRRLTDQLVADLVEQTRVAFTLSPADAEDLEVTDRYALARLKHGAALVTTPRDDDVLQVYRLLADYAGKPALLLRADLPREVLARGAEILAFAQTSTLAAAALLLGVLVFLLHRSVVAPLSRLTEHALVIGKSNDLSARIGNGRTDEIGVLAREFDAMVGRAADSHARWQEATRLGGLGEIATNVLHDVGNVLHNVNVVTSVVTDKLDSKNLKDLERALEAMREHSANLGAYITLDPRGRHLPAFLEGVVRGLSVERAELKSEVQTLTAGVAQIRALVDAHQSLASNSGALERVSLEAQFEAAWNMASAGFNTSAIRVLHEFDEVPPVCTLKHKLLQILVHLLRNAAQSLRDSDIADKRIVLRIARAGSDWVHVEVVDNGVGMSPENVRRVLNQDLAAKHDRHAFGIHSCAIAAREMGGKLSAHSDGIGHGSRFVLEIPTALTGSAARAH